VALEQSHPLGRLWDLDVICPQDGHVGRLSLGLHMRRCLVCDEPAHVCSLAQASGRAGGGRRGEDYQ
jgi:holo-ACP synthase